MTDNFNYGPRMHFDRLHYLDTQTTTTPSGYLDQPSTILSHSDRPSEASLSTVSSTSTLGAHWKKVNSIPMYNGRIDCPVESSFSVPSKPATIPSVMSTLSSASAASGVSSASTSSSHSSSATITGNVLPSDSSLSVSALEHLTEQTETREDRQCLSLQEQGIDKLTEAIHRTSKGIQQSILQMKEVFEEEVQNSKNVMKLAKKCAKVLAENFESDVDTLTKQLETEREQLHQKTDIFAQKAKVEEFVRENEDLFASNQMVTQMMESNLSRMGNIRMMLDFNRPVRSSLTVFEHEDPRVGKVLENVIKMIRSLSLNESERAYMEETIGAVTQNARYDGKFKCETLIRHLLAIMSSWEDTRVQPSISMNSEYWKSVEELNSTGKPMAGSSAFASSSFELSDLPIDDGNLNDLDGELRGSRVQLAVNEHVDSWSSASKFSGWTSASDGHTEILSVGEPMTLSSYEMSSDEGLSTTSSLSVNSMPNATFESANSSSNLDSEVSTTSMKTALSQGDAVVSKPPRSIRSDSQEEPANATRTTFSASDASLNFLTPDDAEETDHLHTAKEANHISADGQTNHLLEALQKSASKCGVALSSLLTAISSSSESLSGTQTSHSMTH